MQNYNVSTPLEFSTEKTSEGYININSCGLCHSNERDSKCNRPSGRVDYQLIYIFEGECAVTADGGDIIAEKGSVIFYRPREPQKYCFYAKDDPYYGYIHFTGNGCEAIFDRLSLGADTVYHLRHHTEIKNLFTRICEEYSKRAQNCEMLCEGMLISMLALIDSYNEKNDTPTPSRKSSEKINEIIAEIQGDPTRELDIEECARRCSLSASRFMTVFKRYTGRSPHRFLTETRMYRAKELLLYSDYTIAEISDSLGYADQNYFSRIFKKYYTVSPSEYRKG